MNTTQQLITELYFNTIKNAIYKLTGYTGQLAQDFATDHFVDTFNDKKDLFNWVEKIENDMPDLKYNWRFAQNKNRKWVLFQV